jgi:hypothetical protein
LRGKKPQSPQSPFPTIETSAIVKNSKVPTMILEADIFDKTTEEGVGNP